MIINCSKHGHQRGEFVSPDIREAVKNNVKLSSVVVVNLEYLEEIVYTAFLSLDYAKKYELENKMNIELPDVYPEWFLLLEPLCQKCLCETAPNVDIG